MLENLKLCYNYFHVPGDDEKSLFRKGVVDSVSKELDEIAVALNSPTISWSDKQECLNFLKSNPKLKIEKSTMSHDFFIGEIALIAGWFIALNHFLESDQDILLVFEDDLWFNNKEQAALNQLKEIIINAPVDNELLFLFSPEDCFEKYSPDLDINNFICTSFATWSTAFTLITRSGAKKILSIFENGVTLCLDLLLIKNLSLIKYAIKPEIQPKYWSTYSRLWLGSTIDPREGLVSRLEICAQDLEF